MRMADVPFRPHYLSAKTLAYTSGVTYLIAGQLIFEDEVVAVQMEVDRLLRNNVSKIIALGHAGFNMDQKIAAEVRGVDLVVGGHTNTFLYTGIRT